MRPLFAVNRYLVSAAAIALVVAVASPVFLANAEDGNAPPKIAAAEADANADDKPASIPVDPPRVKLTTNMGDIVLELEPRAAPQSVKNFLGYVEAGFYSGTIFHRVIDDFMIQGGGFTADYQRKSTNSPIANEANNGLKNQRYTISMARTSAPHSATSQFFINDRYNDFLDHQQPTPRGWGYAVFGRVVEGKQVVDKISEVSTGPGGPFPQDAPQETVIIESASIVMQEPAVAKSDAGTEKTE